MAELCTSGFVDDVNFSHNGQPRTDDAIRAYLRVCGSTGGGLVSVVVLFKRLNLLYSESVQYDCQIETTEKIPMQHRQTTGVFHYSTFGDLRTTNYGTC